MTFPSITLHFDSERLPNRMHVYDTYMVIVLSEGTISYRHPDKNSSPEANEKFIQITEAYEVLSDKKRRHDYDHNQTPSNSFTMFHKNFFFTGHSGDTINMQQYKDRIIPESYHTPFILYFYHDFCLPCLHISRMWNQLKKVLTCGIVIIRYHVSN